MAHEKTRSILEIVTNIAIAAAAIAVVYRLLIAPSPQVITPPGAGGGPAGASVQDIADKGLTTTLATANRAGNASADVVLVEFTDYECPFCARYATDTLGQVRKAFVDTGKVQYALKNYPITQIHKFATTAAEAAACAGQQGKYWEMHGRLFERQKEFAQEIWKDEARALGLDGAAFDTCMGGTMAARVKEDLAEATKLGVQATPTFFVGRRQDDGTVKLVSTIRGAQSFEVFERSLNEAIAETE